VTGETSQDILREFGKRYQDLIKASDWAGERGLPADAKRNRMEEAGKIAQECMDLLLKYVAAANRERESL